MIRIASKERRPKIARLAAMIAATGGCAAALAACGAAQAGSAAAQIGPAVQFARCMRSHGVSGFPDPQPGPDAVVVPAGSGPSPHAPAFQSALAACAKLGPGAVGRRPSATARVFMLHLAECLRAHGLSNVSDPLSSPPAPGRGNVIGRSGVFLSLGPGVDGQSPAFIKAPKACGLRLP